MPERGEKPKRDEPIAIPLDPEEALRGLLKVDPESEPDTDKEPPSKPPRGSESES